MNVTGLWNAKGKTEINKRMVDMLRQIVKNSSYKQSSYLLDIFIALYNARLKMIKHKLYPVVIAEVEGMLRKLDMRIKTLRLEKVPGELQQMKVTLRQSSIAFSYTRNNEVMEKVNQTIQLIERYLNKF